MTASYPASNFTWVDRVDAVDDVMAADVNTLAAEIDAIEADLVGAGNASGLKEAAASFHDNWNADHNTDGSHKQIDGADQALPITIKDNTTQAFSVKQGGNTFIDVDTNDGAECVGIVGNDIIKPDQQLTTADFPNTTTLYIYNCDNASSGNLVDTGGNSKTLTLTGTTTAGNDVLGTSRYNVLDGSNDYFSSADAAFNFTANFSIGGWFALDDWTPTAAQYLMSRYDGTNGWWLYVDTNGEISFRTASGGVQTSATVLGATNRTTGFAAGSWHHFVVVHNTTGNDYTCIYVDGDLWIKNAADTSQVITAAGNLEIGSANGGTAKMAGKIDELFIHNGTLLSASEARSIYNRSSKKCQVTAASGDKTTLPSHVYFGMYKPVLANTANVSSSSPLGAENWHFSRIGDMVTIFIGVQITPTAGSAATTLTFDLPIPCTNTPAGHGCVACDTVNRSGGVTAASATTGTIDHYSAGTSAYNFRGSFSYIIN